MRTGLRLCGVIMGAIMIAFGMGGAPASTTARPALCELARQRYATLSDADASSCAELVTLAKACSGDGDDWRDYVPRVCGGNCIDPPRKT